jgi:hypothetical protein
VVTSAHSSQNRTPASTTRRRANGNMGTSIAAVLMLFESEGRTLIRWMST